MSVQQTHTISTVTGLCRPVRRFGRAGSSRPSSIAWPAGRNAVPAMPGVF